MARSLKKGFFVNEKLMMKVLKMKELPIDERGKSAIKTWSRSSTITPEMIGLSFDVHNGKTFSAIKIMEDMVGHKLGEFSPTRKFSKHGGKLQREIDTKSVKAK